MSSKPLIQVWTMDWRTDVCSHGRCSIWIDVCQYGCWFTWDTLVHTKRSPQWTCYTWTETRASSLPIEPAEEVELSEYFLKAAKIGYGKTRRDVLGIAESVAKSKGMLPEGSRISTGWWKRFLERNPVLSLRRGDATAGVRMDAINAVTIQQYYSLLRDVYDQHDFESHPERV